MSYNKVESENEELQERMKQIFQDEKKAIILYMVRLYEPINLKMMSQISGQAENTLHYHLTKLRDEYIEITDQNIEGKFYRLRDEVRKFFKSRFQRSLQEYEELAPQYIQSVQKFEETGDASEISDIKEKMMSSLEDIGSRYDTIEASFTLDRTIKSISLQSIVELSKQAMKEGLDFEKILSDPKYFGSFNHVFTSLPLTKFSHAMKFSSLMVDFLNKVQQLKEEIEAEIEQNNIPSDEIGFQYWSLFSSPQPHDMKPVE